MNMEVPNWQKAARTEGIEHGRKDSLSDLSKNRHIELADLNQLSLSEDDSEISGRLQGQEIRLTKSERGVEGVLGQNTMSTEDAEVQYITLSNLIAARDQVNHEAIEGTHRQIAAVRPKEDTSAIRAKFDKLSGKTEVSMYGNLSFQADGYEALNIVRDGFLLGRRAAEQIMGFSFSEVPFHVVERYDARAGIRVNTSLRHRESEASFDPPFYVSALDLPSLDKFVFAEYVCQQLLESEAALKEIVETNR